MDRRREPRFESGQQVQLTLLGEEPVTMPAEVENISGRGMRLIAGRRLPVNGAVRVDLNGSILLGEVCYTEPVGERFAFGLVLNEVLHEVPELQPLIEAISSEEKRPAGEPAPRPAVRPGAGGKSC